MLIGLTGGYCSGKNSAAAILERRGFLAIDVDRLGHAALDTEEGRKAVAARFGPGYLSADGSVDRKGLGKAVFGDRAALADLEAIVHPIVYRLLGELLEPALAAGRDVCVNAALLYRMPEASRCDAILELKAPIILRLRRGRERDGLSFRRVLERIASQRAFWARRRAVGRPIFFVENRGGLEALERNVDKALDRAGMRSGGAAH